jgi:penicillin amidase
MGKWILRILGGLLLLLVITAIGGYFWLRSSLPQTGGTVTVQGISAPVEIVRDGDGVPHIFAATDADAFYALGYVHAQDRMWQLEMNRRIGAGRLSEILGEATLTIDKFQRTMGYARLVKSDYEAISAGARAALDAYAAGVNQWLGEGHTLPPEFQLLGFKPAPWSPYDSLVWQKMMAWDLSGDYEQELLRAQLAAALGPERMRQLLPDYPAGGITILPQLDADAAASLLALGRQLELDFARGGREAGSNNWVVAGSRTASGLPLANDPHLATSIPSIWYLAELQGDTIHAIGATFPALPAVVIGHNEQVAWGVTNMGPDVQDLFVERINPDNPTEYAVAGDFVPITVVEELITVKGEAEPVVWAARSTRHGPLISDVTDTGSPLALKWTALQPNDTTMDAFLGLNYAHNWADFTASLAKFIAPSQNFVYADRAGNIGYYAPGQVPIRPAGDNGMAPVPGWDGAHEWQRFIPFAEMPHAYNPAAGFIATANNLPVGPDFPYLLGNDWAPPYRAERITELITAMSSDGETLSVEDMALIQGDQTSTQTRRLLPFFLQVPPADERQQQAIARLRDWDGAFTLESGAAPIYEAWMIHLERSLFGDDLRGSLYEEMADTANPTFLETVLADATLSAAWCNDVLTPPLEDCNAIAQRALGDALDDLSARMGDDIGGWQWQKIHITQYPHNPFSQVDYLKGLFHRSIANGGDRFTVNVAPSRLSQLYDQTHVPGYRHIVDLNDLNNSRFMITTGQSGNVLSPHYDDFITRHRDVAYLPMRFGREAVTGEVLRLEPAGP